MFGAYECLDESAYELVELLCPACFAVVIMERAVWEVAQATDLAVEE